MTHHATTPSGKARRLFGTDVAVTYAGETKRWYLGGFDGRVFVNRERYGASKYTAWLRGGAPSGIAAAITAGDTLDEIAERLTEQGWLPAERSTA